MDKQSICLFGDGCSGKSASIATLFKLLPSIPDMRVIFVATESNAFRGVKWGIQHHKLDLKENQLILAEVKPKVKKAFSAKLGAFKAYAAGTGKDAYQVGKDTKANKDKYTYLISVIEKLDNFSGIDFISEKEINLGNIAELGKNDFLVIDGLSSITHGVWNLLQGDRLVNDMNDYQVVQKQVVDITSELVTSTECHVILLAHEETAKDGKIRIALKAGQALHGSYKGLWTNVIYSYKTGAGGFFWAGKKMNVADIAARDFPEKDSLVQDFSLYNFFK